MVNGEVKIIHYEVVHGASGLGRLSSAIEEEFSEERINAIRAFFLRECNNCKVVYEKHVVVEGASENLVNQLRDMLAEKVVEHVKEFFAKIVGLARSYAAKYRTLPDSCWLLNMLRSLAENGLL
ncbi:MAG TPA: hypothetical protein EYP33_01755 [Pyrodictium sp.]|nr:hypothetical protein [Pyrodictium sp.]